MLQHDSSLRAIFCRSREEPTKCPPFKTEPGVLWFNHIPGGEEYVWVSVCQYAVIDGLWWPCTPKLARAESQE